jgi:alcohol dehydrogenase class IV
MLQSFTLEQPPSIFFGAGTRNRLPELIPRFGRRVVLFTGHSWLSRSGWRERLLALLEPFELSVLPCAAGEPVVEEVAGLLDRVRALGPDVIVAVGGGSVLDTAKAVSALLGAAGGVEDYLEGIGRGLQLERAGVPWLALPTTAGTGAEATKNAVLKSRAHGAKKSLRSPHLLASCVLVDPELSVGAPLGLCGASGMDALTQLIESYVSRKAAPIPRALARAAFPVMLSALKAIPRNPEDLDARTAAAFGALCSGIALANSGLGAAHGFASGLGGLYDIPHGLICAVFMRPVLRANAELIRRDCEQLRQAAREYGRQSISAGGESGAEGAAGHEDAVAWLAGEIEALFELYELPRDLRGLGVDRELIPEIARRSSGSSMSGNPRELSQQERELILAELL